MKSVAQRITAHLYSLETTACIVLTDAVYLRFCGRWEWPLVMLAAAVFWVAGEIQEIRRREEDRS